MVHLQLLMKLNRYSLCDKISVITQFCIGNVSGVIVT